MIAGESIGTYALMYLSASAINAATAITGREAINGEIAHFGKKMCNGYTNGNGQEDI